MPWKYDALLLWTPVKLSSSPATTELILRKGRPRIAQAPSKTHDIHIVFNLLIPQKSAPSTILNILRVKLTYERAVFLTVERSYSLKVIALSVNWPLTYPLGTAWGKLNDFEVYKKILQRSRWGSLHTDSLLFQYNWQLFYICRNNCSCHMRPQWNFPSVASAIWSDSNF